MTARGQVYVLAASVALGWSTTVASARIPIAAPQQIRSETVAELAPDPFSVRPVLTTLSEQEAIASAEEAAKRGEIPETGVVGLCAQMTSAAGRACLFKYLAEGSLDAKAAAVRALGSVPAYTPIVRDKIYLAHTVDSKLRAAAADVLAQFDESFASYALTVVLDPKTPPELVAAAVRGYVWSAKAHGKFDAAQRELLLEALKNQLQVLGDGPAADPLRAIYDQLRSN